MKKGKMYQKLLAAGMAMALAFMTACGGPAASSGSSSSASQDPEETAQAQTKLTVEEALMGDEDDTDLVVDEDTDFEDESGEMSLDLEEETFSGEADGLDFSIFSSEKMAFSFLYEPVHTAYITEDGAAQLAINGDESLCGLSVAVKDAADVPDPAQAIAEAKETIRQKYQGSMEDDFDDDSFHMEEHDLTGFEYEYKNEKGEEIECTWLIEESQEAPGRFIIYQTASADANDEITLEALSIAVESIVMESGFYGDSNAVSGSIN